ncbi:MAG TPA: SDR family oxidoreductase [Alphaproteobacteria bacterium]|nr:SDR family oxidoreductase [Alphaproteobacteria bacterium]HIN91964.1 SDR family oxidoreductase [Alphaproteobacteria bacterium]
MAKKRIALVTGASGGIGQAVVARLIKDGFEVAAMDINKTTMDELIEKIPSGMQPYVCDQTDEDATRKTVTRIETEMGPIHALVNTIGWVGTTRFMEEDSDYWRKVIAINLESVLYVTHAVLKNMIDRQQGTICNVASDAGRVGTSGEAVYSACKAGIIGLCKSLARENARYNINVNAVSPGPTQTPLLQAEIEENPDLIRRMTKLIPFRKVAQPEDQAGAISYLVSDDAAYVTGQVISVSGGLTMVD